MNENQFTSMKISVGESRYHEMKIQPWELWEKYKLDPWRADIVKRVLRRKGEREEDLAKISHLLSFLEEYESKHKWKTFWQKLKFSLKHKPKDIEYLIEENFPHLTYSEVRLVVESFPFLRTCPRIWLGHIKAQRKSK